MLLAEVKKLKVAELRAMLTERGLDPKGLKAELVVRLISAIEAGVEPVIRGNEGSMCETKEEEEKRVKAQSPVCTDPFNKSMHTYTDQSTQTEPFQLCSCAATFNITQQQTTTGTSEDIIKDIPHPKESDAAPLDVVVMATTAAVDQDVVSECSSTVFAHEQDHSVPKKRSDELETVDAVTLATAAAGDRDVVSGYSSTVFANSLSVPNRQIDEPEIVDAGLEDNRGIKRPNGVRGRDFYEFKEEVQYNRAKTPEPLLDTGDEYEIDFEDVRLDSYNCDLHFEVSSDGSSGQPFLWEKFPLLWSGCRMTHGFSQGKIGFEAKFVNCLSTPALDTSYDPEPHVLRVGWSVDNTSLQLGEAELSYGFDGRGKIITKGQEEEFGEPFTEGDVIGCFAAISDSGEASLSFHKNGRSLGEAFQVSVSTLKGRALYPHVLCKNCSVSVNLDQDSTWHPFPAGFCTLTSLPPGQRTRAFLPATSRKECEVLMMVGMPGSGKTHWAQTHMTQNPRKRYNLLSTNSVLDCMRIPSGGNHRDLMLQQATQCVSHLIRIAANKRKNYIIDQANIYPSAQRHKMMCFHGYQRKAVVVFPADAVWKRRLIQHQEKESTDIPEISLLKAKASFTLPQKDEYLDEVMFVELGFDEASKLLTQYKEEARKVLPAHPKRKKHRHGNQKHLIHHCGWRGGPISCQSNNYCKKSSSGQSYGYRSDPQRYRNYYRPYTGQWNWCDQAQNYLNSLNYSCSS